MAAPTAAERTITRAPPISRTFTQWTPDDLDAALALTGAGSLQRAADLCWALLGDARVRAALETRVKGLLRLPLTWEEAGDRRSAGRVVKALDGGDFYAAHSEAALYALCAWGILLGIGIARRVWVRQKSGRWLGVLRPYDPRYLRWDAHRRVWVVRTDAGEIDVVPGDRRWVLYAPSCSGQPDGDERPWLWGAWRACAKAWLGADLAWSDWMGHSEVHGAPIRTADFDPAMLEAVQKGTVEKPRREELANALSDLGGDTAIVPVPGYKIRLVEAVARTWEMFPKEMDVAARTIVVAITGQASSVEVLDGQETGATLHGQVRGDLIRADGQTLATCLHDQSIVDYTAINFGDDELAPWPRYQTDPPVDVKARAESYRALGDGIAALERVLPEGKVLDRQAMFEQAGIPLKNAPVALPVVPPTPITPPPDVAA